jgi:hypothetical protein
MKVESELNKIATRPETMEVKFIGKIESGNLYARKPHDDGENQQNDLKCLEIKIIFAFNNKRAKINPRCAVHTKLVKIWLKRYSVCIGSLF